MTRLLTFAGLLFILFCPPSGQGQTVKTFSSDFDIYDEVITFTKESIDTHPKLQAQYDKLVQSAASEDSDRPPAPGTRVAIKWQVPQSTTKVDEAGGTKEEEFVFLVKQALSNSFHGGFSVEDNIVARILVTTHETLVPDPKKEGEFITKKVEATFTWDGFVKLEITPVSD